MGVGVIAITIAAIITRTVELRRFMGCDTGPGTTIQHGCGSRVYQKLSCESHGFSISFIAFIFCVVFVFCNSVPVRVLYCLLTRHIVVVFDLNYPPSFFLFYFRLRLAHEQCVRAESPKFQERIEKSFIFIQRLPNHQMIILEL